MSILNLINLTEALAKDRLGFYAICHFLQSNIFGNKHTGFAFWRYKWRLTLTHSCPANPIQPASQRCIRTILQRREKPPTALGHMNMYTCECVYVFIAEQKKALYIAVILCAFPLADKTINHFNNLLEANTHSASRKS